MKKALCILLLINFTGILCPLNAGNQSDAQTQNTDVIPQTPSHSLPESNEPKGDPNVDKSPEPEWNTESEELPELALFVATGSHIPLTEYDSFSSVVNLSYDEIILQGNQTPMQALRQLPSIYGTTNTENLSNGGSGSASPNIRALGNLNTLTLINGRRATTSSAIGLQPGGFGNLNLIPVDAISSIEVFQGGATTTYGSDAVAGAVNVLLDNDYEGARVRALYGDTSDGGGETQQYSAIGGFTEGKAHVTAFVSYYNRDTIWARDRSLSSNSNFIPRGGSNFNSRSYPGVIYVSGNPTYSTLKPGIDVPASINDYEFLDPITGGYNYSAEAPAIPGQTFKDFFGTFDYELTEKISLFADVLYSDNTQSNGLAQSGWSSYNLLQLLTPAQNSQYLPSGIAPDTLELWGYRSFALSQVQDIWDRDAYRLTGGLRGDIDDRWNWETALLFINNDTSTEWTGIMDASQLIPMIEDGRFNPFATAFSTGTILSGPLAGQTYDNAAALSSLSTTATDNFNESMLMWDASLDGEVFTIDSGPVLGAAGLELRRETVEADYSSLRNSYNAIYVPGALDYNADRLVISGWGETVIPIVSPEQEISGIYSLSLNLGARLEGYKDSGANPVAGTGTENNSFLGSSFKAAINYKPIHPLTLRGSFNTGYRAPTLYESYSRRANSNVTLYDPQNPSSTGTYTPIVNTGNPNLDPETSTEFDIGITYQPKILPGLSVSVDYFHVQIDDAIANGAQFILDNESLFPGRVERNTSGNIIQVNSQFMNVAGIVTQGIEYGVNYDSVISPDLRWSAALGVNQLLTYRVQATPNSPSVSYKGGYKATGSNDLSPGALPTWRGFLSGFIYPNNFILGATLNYIGSYQDDSNYTYDMLPRRVSDYLTLDLVAGYTFDAAAGTWLENLSVLLGVNNAFNISPPFVAGSAIDGYDVTSYSIQNRYLWASISKEF